MGVPGDPTIECPLCNKVFSLQRSHYPTGGAIGIDGYLYEAMKVHWEKFCKAGGT